MAARTLLCAAPLLVATGCFKPRGPMKAANPGAPKLSTEAITGVPLEPTAPGREPLSPRVERSAHGVTVGAQAGTWRGARSIADDITPVHLSIRNRSGKTIEIAYEQVALLGPSGQRWAALPPYEIDGTGQELKVSGRYRPITTPYFKHVGFNVVSLYAPLYPNVSTSGGARYSTPPVRRWPYARYAYHRRYNSYWKTYDLPTPGMLLRVLPEGTLSEGGFLSGYIYFEKTDPRFRQVTLVCTLVDDQRGTPFGRVDLPLTIPDHLRLPPPSANQKSSEATGSSQR